MFAGELVSIFVTAESAGRMEAVQEADAVPGKGVSGDRYHDGRGSFSKPNEPDREVTLIEIEAIYAIGDEYDIEFDPRDSRRNLLTRNVPLNHLVGQEFAVGETVLRGIRLCEPCKHLEELTCEGVEKALRHRGGLRAQIVTGGRIHCGDAVRPLADSTDES